MTDLTTEQINAARQEVNEMRQQVREIGTELKQINAEHQARMADLQRWMESRGWPSREESMARHPCSPR